MNLGTQFVRVTQKGLGEFEGITWSVALVDIVSSFCVLRESVTLSAIRTGMGI